VVDEPLWKGWAVTAEQPGDAGDEVFGGGVEDVVFAGEFGCAVGIDRAGGGGLGQWGGGISRENEVGAQEGQVGTDVVAGAGDPAWGIGIDAVGEEWVVLAGIDVGHCGSEDGAVELAAIEGAGDGAA